MKPGGPRPSPNPIVETPTSMRKSSISTPQYQRNPAKQPINSNNPNQNANPLPLATLGVSILLQNA